MPQPMWLLPTPGGPKIRIVAPLSSHESPLASAMTWALDSIGRSANSKLASVLVTSSCDSARSCCHLLFLLARQERVVAGYRRDLDRDVRQFSLARGELLAQALHVGQFA